MLKIAFRGLAERKARSALTTLAVLLGVAMVAGTLMLTESVDRSFDNLFAEVNAGIDVNVKPELAVEESFEAPTSGVTLKESLVNKIDAVEGVKQTIGAIADPTISVLDADGERIGPMGPPHLALSTAPEPINAFTYPDGREPSGPGEVAIDTTSIDDAGFEIGQQITIAGARKARTFELVGAARFGSGSGLGATLAVFTLEEAQLLTGKLGKLDEIAIEAEDGVDSAALAKAVQKVVPRNVVARTGAEDASEQADDISSQFSFLSIALLVFAGVALLVGTFLIFNTFSITVAQRTREFALLRTIGATGRQIRTAVLIEAATLGFAAAILGVLGGIGFVYGITGLFEAAGFKLPTEGIVIPNSAIIASMVIGVGVTVVSSLIPAIRATRVSPIEGLHSDLTAPEVAPSRRRGVLGALLLVAGLGLMLAGLFATDTLGSAFSLLGGGLVLIFLAVVALGERLIRPLASAVGAPIVRFRGVTGRLARENTLRNPSRTSTTATSLMIGLALVIFVAVFAESLKTSFDEIIDRQFAGDLALVNVTQELPISSDIPEALSGVDGVDVISPFSVAGVDIQGVGTGTINGLVPGAAAKAINFDWKDGSDELLAELGPRDLIAESTWAEDNGIEVGEQVRLTAPGGSRTNFTVVGTAEDQPGLVFNPIAARRSTVQDLFDTRGDQYALLVLESGADFDRARAKIDRILESDFPDTQSRSQQELREDQSEALDTLLTMIYALLALSVIVSMFGVVNTLMLTIHERTRELGMLRAIGTSRSQIRRMIRYESLITALIGAVIGAVIGLGVGAAAVIALEGEGLVLSIPWLLTAITFLVAGIAGVVAAILPARRASKLDVIEALQYE